MKVLMINGSPHENGTTMRALREVEKTLNASGVDTEIITVGNKNIAGCKGCGACRKAGKCVYNDVVSEALEKMEFYDGLIIGSPVYYASINGTLKCFLDRFFYSGNAFSHKVGAAVVCARRAGTTASLDIIYKYLSISNMVIATSNYWNMVHGANAADAEKDLEGLQTMRVLGKNIAWLVKSLKTAKENGVFPPANEKKIKTNFIREEV